jgi:hypothetical protein
MLFDIFRIEVPKWLPDLNSQASVPGSFTLFSVVDLYEGHARVAMTNEDLAEGSADVLSYYNGSGERVNLLSQHLAMLLIAFIDSGLLEVNRKPLIVNLYCRRWLS